MKFRPIFFLGLCLLLQLPPATAQWGFLVEPIEVVSISDGNGAFLATLRNVSGEDKYVTHVSFQYMCPNFEQKGYSEQKVDAHIKDGETFDVEVTTGCSSSSAHEYVSSNHIGSANLVALECQAGVKTWFIKAEPVGKKRNVLRFQALKEKQNVVINVLNLAKQEKSPEENTAYIAAQLCRAVGSTISDPGAVRDIQNLLEQKLKEYRANCKKNREAYCIEADSVGEILGTSPGVRG